MTTRTAVAVLGVVAGAMLPQVGHAQNQAASHKRAPAAAAASVMAIERKAWDAMKASDPAAFNRSGWTNFTYVDANGVVQWAPQMAEGFKDCTMTRYTFEKESATSPAPDLIVLTYKATHDHTCNGQKDPSPIYVLSIYRKSAAGWRPVAHSETPATATAAP